MNPHFLIRLLSMALWLGAVLHSHADDLPDVSQINVEDARNELVALDEVQREKFCEAVLQSERKDLIELCMVTPMAAGNISRAMIKIPDSPFRRELVLLLLRTPGKRWPDIPGDFNTDKLRIIAVGGVTAYVGQYLPDTPITWEVIGSPERRLKLADAFEAAVARVTAESPAAAQTRTNPRPPRRASSDPGRERARCRAAGCDQ